MGGDLMKNIYTHIKNYFLKLNKKFEGYKDKDSEKMMQSYKKFSFFKYNLLYGIFSNYKRTLFIVYLFTYIFLMLFSYNPFTSFFQALFLNAFISVFFSLLTIFFLFLDLAFITAVMFFIRPLNVKKPVTNNVFESIFGEASADFFEEECENDKEE